MAQNNSLAKSGSTSGHSDAQNAVYQAGKKVRRAISKLKRSAEEHQIKELVASKGTELAKKYEDKTGRKARTDGVVAAAAVGVVGAVMLTSSVVSLAVTGAAVAGGAVLAANYAKHKGHDREVDQVVGALKQSAEVAKSAVIDAFQGVKKGVQEAQQRGKH